MTVQEVNLEPNIGETFLERTEREFLEQRREELSSRLKEKFIPTKRKQPMKDLTELYLGLKKEEYYQLIEYFGHPVNKEYADDHDFLVDL